MGTVIKVLTYVVGGLLVIVGAGGTITTLSALDQFGADAVPIVLAILLYIGGLVFAGVRLIQLQRALKARGQGEPLRRS